MMNHFCEIVLNLDYWHMKKCHSKIFLLLAMVAILFSRTELFVQFW